ncbi:chromate transporter [Xanthobacter autotrophicus]|jgi:chromate transporter|uniref:Chromate transporter n=1 Tax=Xanthobacter autotrophicus TaxID=280 RepID=A0A6C1KHY5_XANAU|nr:chromate transporter [Xanthobacter autotrophicus]TLX43902.1 chromate transporter [Xanthobacter autotrophicus]
MSQSNSDLSLLGVFSLLSLLAIGGGTAVLPEMKQLTVEAHHWITDGQFRDIYALGQVAPGPNMLMVIVIGYHVAGTPGALIAFAGFFLPASTLALGASRLWNHFEGSPWRLALQNALAPIVVGLMAAGMIAIARTAITGTETTLLAIAVFALLYFGPKINPALLILAGGAVGYLTLS